MLLTNVNLEPTNVDHKQSGNMDIIHVLHVDDDADFLQVAKEILEMNEPFQVDTAGSVEEAYAKMSENKFDVIVSDYQMPIKDGLDFLKELRYNKNSIPFILFTGKGREEVAIKALYVGADGYFIKSGDTETVFSELAYGIRQIVEKKRVEHSLCERVKELHCLYELARLLEEPNMTIDKILEETINLLSTAWQNPDIAGARIVFENREYKTKNFKETLHKQQVDLKAKGKKVGVVELCYIEEIPAITKNLFIREEITLIYITAERLGKIIEHKKAEEEIRSLAKFPNENPNPVLRVAKDGTVLFANAAAKQVLTKEKSGVGKLVPVMDRQLVSNVLKLGVNKKKEVELEGKVFSFVFNPITDEGYVNLYGRDITRRKEAEKDLFEAFNELALVNEKLDVVGKLTRHDVWNKLFAVTGNIYLAKQMLPPNSEVVKYLNETESAVDQIEKIFDFARTYEQLGVEKLSYIDVGKSFERATSLHADLSGIEIVNDCSGVNVLADSLLNTLFYNLMDNSIKHGEKVSRIGIHCKTGKDSLKLVYDDDGVGISASEKEVIFKEGYRNTGLGLAMIKKMCNVYGWTRQTRQRNTIHDNNPKN